MINFSKCPPTFPTQEARQQKKSAEDARSRTEKREHTIVCLTKTAHRRLSHYEKRTDEKTLTSVNPLACWGSSHGSKPAAASSMDKKRLPIERVEHAPPLFRPPVEWRQAGILPARGEGEEPSSPRNIAWPAPGQPPAPGRSTTWNPSCDAWPGSLVKLPPLFSVIDVKPNSILNACGLSNCIENSNISLVI